MGRPVVTALQNLLNLAKGANTQTTLDLQFTDNGYDFQYATDTFTVDASPDRDYLPYLQRSNELKQSVFASPNRVTLAIQNVDKAIGATAQDEVYTKSVAIVGRYYRDPDNVLPAVWVELFRGEANCTDLDEMSATIEVLHDLAACGYCVGDWSLGENCQFVFKQTDTCGYSGGSTTCNKKRKSSAGCSGRSNEFHFGGMEFPDPQPAAAPTGGNTDPDPEPPHGPCARVDQLVPVEQDGLIALKRAGNIKAGVDRIFNPLTGRFHGVTRARVVKDQPIWVIESSTGACGYSSASHPVMPFRGHVTGVPVSKMQQGDAMLLWNFNGSVKNHAVSNVEDAGTIGDVMQIEMEDGHVYAYGDGEEDIFIVCHNKRYDP